MSFSAVSWVLTWKCTRRCLEVRDCVPLLGTSEGFMSEIWEREIALLYRSRRECRNRKQHNWKEARRAVDERKLGEGSDWYVKKARNTIDVPEVSRTE